MFFIVVLVLVTHDCDTGAEVGKFTREFPYTPGENVEACRSWAVEKARSISNELRALGMPNASTNIECHLEFGPGQTS